MFYIIKEILTFALKQFSLRYRTGFTSAFYLLDLDPHPPRGSISRKSPIIRIRADSDPNHTRTGELTLHSRS